jgi:DNA uptake protein ComE-like DNA-binding protein
VSVRGFLDFTGRQLRVMAVLTVTAVLMGGYMLVRVYGYPPRQPAPPEVLGADSAAAISPIFVVDPNTAPIDSLELLPGIGPVLAGRIAEYRQHARFEKEADITAVKGIGPGLYERLKPYLKVTPE